MSEFKGTKGKWEVEFDTTSLQKHIKCGNKYIAEVSFGSVESNSNAKLIAHAPEMLYILQEFLSDFDNGLIEDFQITRDRFEKLIKEATEF